MDCSPTPRRVAGYAAAMARQIGLSAGQGFDGTGHHFFPDLDPGWGLQCVEGFTQFENNTHVEQSLDLVAGTYLLTWADAGRRHYGATRYDVLFGNSLLNATSFATLPGQAWSTHSLSFTASGPGALRFQGLAYSADGTAFIDNLSLTLTAAAPAAAPAASTGQVPEPTSFGLVAVALMLAGLGGRAGLRRRVSVAG